MSELLNNEKEQFKQQLLKLGALRDASWQEFKKILHKKSFSKGAVILEAGKTPKNLYFILEGAIIIYYESNNGTVYTKNILFENEFPAATAALIQNKPSHLTIEAVEDATLIAFNYKKFKNLVRFNSDINNIYINYIEKYWIVRKEKIQLSLATEQADVRYKELLELYPAIEQRIPLYHLASYLGITPTQLSRIRKNR